jgi:hypothetical protein
MARDTLFLLPPGFEDQDRREYCPECGEVWGLLNYFPALKETLNIIYVPITHPRGPITDVLGDGQFNAPTLVLAEGTGTPSGVSFKTANGRKYIDSARGLAALWAARYGTPVRRGS